jgi:hypothetical protein
MGAGVIASLSRMADFVRLAQPERTPATQFREPAE